MALTQRLLGRVALLALLLLGTTYCEDKKSTEQLKARLSDIESKIGNVEAKLTAIENLKMYQQKAKVQKLNQAHLDEVSNLYKHTLH